MHRKPRNGRFRPDDGIGWNEYFGITDPAHALFLTKESIEKMNGGTRGGPYLSLTDANSDND